MYIHIYIYTHIYIYMCVYNIIYIIDIIFQDFKTYNCKVKYFSDKLP